ncbi:MAG: winged helix-turn-helix transcriptional regulator [Promethearchaeota archaeon]
MSEKELKLKKKKELDAEIKNSSKTVIKKLENYENYEKSKLLEKSKLKPNYNSLNEVTIEIQQEKEESLEVYLDKIEEIRDELMQSLTDIEKDVLRVANEIIKRKKYEPKFDTERIEKMSPMVEEIYSKCVAKFHIQKGYDKEAIFNAILNLEKKKWIITGQRLTKDMILKNPLKKKLIAFIEKYPGIHARDPKVKEILGITRNPFIKHMASLETFGFIRSSKIGATLNYFPANLDNKYDELAVLFQNDIVLKIIKIFIKNPNTTLIEMANQIGVYHRAVQYHIDALIKHNVLIELKQGDEELKKFGKLDSRRKYYKLNKELLLNYNNLFGIPPFKEWIQ